MNLTIGTTSDGKSFNIEADSFVTKACAIIGIRGSGKTYAAEKLAELIYDAGKQIIVIDPVGVWYSLRLGERKGQGLDVTIFGGLHGDIPLSKASGALIADVLIDRQISAVIDVSQFETDADKARFARDFADRFYFRKKSNSIKTPVHIFVEEAQEFIPQNIQRGEEQMLHVWQRMIRLGRNFKIGVSMISQRPQDVNKKALNQAEWVFAFQLRGTQERKAVEDWIANNGIDENLAQRLPSLIQGEAYVWSPSANTVVRIGKKRTFDASSDISQDESAAEPKPLRTSDLEVLRKSFAAIEIEQKSNDPKALKLKIVELEKQLAKPATVSVSKSVEPKRIEVPVLKEGQLKRAEAIIEKLSKLLELGNNVFTSLAVALQKVNAPAPKPEPQKPYSLSQQVTIPAKKLPTQLRISTQTNGPVSTSSGLRRMLAALAQFPNGLSADRMGILADISPSSGTFGTYLGKARSEQWIEGDRNNLRITGTGLEFLGEYEPLPVGEDLRSYWLNHSKVTGAAKNMLRVFIDNYPNSVSRETLAEGTGISGTSGTFGTYLGRLRGLGLVDGWRASDSLFN